MKLVLLIVIFAFVALQTATALRCYVCTGDKDSDCAKAVPSAMQLAECSTGSQSQCFSSDISRGDIRVFSRNCAKSTGSTDLCSLLTRWAGNPSAMKVFSCNVCDTDFCNTAITV